MLASLKRLFSRTSEIDDKIQKIDTSFSGLKDEFNDHLEAINENTNEIQLNYEYMCEMDQKIAKLSERMDEVTMLLRKQAGIMIEERPVFEISPLTKKEKEIFQALYVLEEEKGSVSYTDIGRRLGLPESLVQSYTANLLEKGVPIIKRYVHNQVFLKLDTVFREIQAKENLVGIDPSISESVISR